jgi:hypothetical protein
MMKLEKRNWKRGFRGTPRIGTLLATLREPVKL